jgi:hypothetical protein
MSGILLLPLMRYELTLLQPVDQPHFVGKV